MRPASRGEHATRGQGERIKEKKNGQRRAKRGTSDGTEAKQDEPNPTRHGDIAHHRTRWIDKASSPRRPHPTARAPIGKQAERATPPHPAPSPLVDGTGIRAIRMEPETATQANNASPMKSQQGHKGRKERTREARRNRIRPPRRQPHTRPGVRANPEEQASNGNRGHEAHEPQSDADRRRDASNPTSRTPAAAPRSKATPATRPRPDKRATARPHASRHPVPPIGEARQRGERAEAIVGHGASTSEEGTSHATATRRYGRIENGKQARTRTHAKADGIATRTGRKQNRPTPPATSPRNRDHEPQDEDKQANYLDEPTPPAPTLDMI